MIPPSARRALALPLVLLMLVLVVTVGYAYIDLTRARFGLSYKAVHYGRAYYLAEAGVQWSAFDLDRGGDGVAVPEDLPAELVGLVSSYDYRLEVQAEPLPGGRSQITSRATVGGVTVVLEAVRDLRALAVLRGRP